MKGLLRHPFALPAAALATGLLAAFLLARPFAPASIALPTWLANLLSATGDRNLVVTHPEVLWLLPVAVLPYLISVARRSLVDLPGFQIVAQFALRGALLMGLALAMSQPTLRAPVRGKTVVLAIDVSDSVDDDQLTAAQGLVSQATAAVERESELDLDRADRTRLRLLSYAERAEAHLPEAMAGSSVIRPPAGTLGSDHAGALRLAKTLLDPETEGRVVLITDGKGSLAEREDLVRAVRELRDDGVELHVRRFPARSRGDVLVEAIHVAPELRVGQTFEVAIDLFATEPVELKLSLDRNGTPNPLAPSTTVKLRGGRQQVKMPARVTAPGPVTFTARLKTASLDPTRNRTDLNDAAATVAEVRGRPRVLHLGTDPSSALVRALRADHLAVDDITAGQFPDTAAGLLPYDLVIFSDVPARAVPGARQLGLKQYVEELGGGFIMVGGEHAYGLGGWGGTTVEGLLPVKFEGERQRQQPTLALVLVMDKSGSMSSEDKLDLVKEAARATARTLDPSDELGVIAFDSRPQVLVRLQPAANRIRIAADIRRLSAGGGTNALPALREAYLQLAGSNALVKHVILLSDGQSPEAGIAGLLGDMRDADVTVSAVGVGAGAGKDFLSRVAQQGRGRFYFSQDGTDVPRIFSRETIEVTRNAVIERELLPRVAKSVQALRGIDFSRAPGLRGIVPVKPKSMSETLLRTQMGEALLVRGRRGLGRTAAFASDAKPRWASRWMTWSGFPKLWSQLARDTMRQGAGMIGGATIGVSSAAGNRWRVTVDTEAPEGFSNDLEGEVAVVDPISPDDTANLPLRLTAPGRYEAEIPGGITGQRLVKAKLYDVSQSPRRLAAEATGRITVPYPPELAPDREGAAARWVDSLVEDPTDGPVEPIIDRAGDPRGRTRSRALWPEVLWGLVFPLLLLDLLLRRVALGRRRIAAR